jgi:signal transduction histidine kinase
MQSHEVRRPLTSILGLIELIEEQELKSDMKELIVNLKIASNQLDEIIHDIVKRTRNY